MVKEVLDVMILLASQQRTIIVDVSQTGRSAREVAHQLSLLGIRVGADGANTLRLVTHAEVDEAGVREALERFSEM